MGSADSKFVRFSGVVDTLQVVAARTMLDHTFAVETPLNGGRKIELRHKPQVPPRVRLDASPPKRYAVYTQKEIAGLKVTWEDEPDIWSPGLTIALPKGPFSGKAQWEAHFFGADTPQWADGMPMQSNEAISYAVERKNLEQIYQARRKSFKQYGEDLAGFYYLSDKKAAPPIEQTAALSDPKGQARFNYKARTHNGYHFTVLPKSQAALSRLDQTRRNKGLSYTYNGQTMKALPNRHLSDLAAIPADQSQPTFFINWGRVYMKHLNGQTLTHVPDNYYGSDWKEADFIER